MEWTLVDIRPRKRQLSRWKMSRFFCVLGHQKKSFREEKTGRRAEVFAIRSLMAKSLLAGPDLTKGKTVYPRTGSAIDR